MIVATPLKIAVITVSDTRTKETDKSGKVLIDNLLDSGHLLHSKIIVKDDVYDLRAIVSAHIADPEVNVVLTTGGTGFTSRDNTQKALQILLIFTSKGLVNCFVNFLLKKLVIRQFSLECSPD